MRLPKLPATILLFLLLLMGALVALSCATAYHGTTVPLVIRNRAFDIIITRVYAASGQQVGRFITGNGIDTVRVRQAEVLTRGVSVCLTPVAGYRTYCSDVALRIPGLYDILILEIQPNIEQSTLWGQNLPPVLPEGRG
jgi:hypothetical protein